MPLTLASSGGGSVTLTVPSTASGFTATLPAVTATILTTSSTDTVNSLNAGIGVNQTWQDVLASRSAGVTYTNSTGKPILVNIQTSQTGGSNPSASIAVSGVKAAQDGQSNVPGGATLSVIVPNGATYVYTTAGNAATIWVELR